MMVFRPGDRLHVTAGPGGRAADAARRRDPAAARATSGGTSSPPRSERIEAAKEAWRAGDWEHGRFHLPPGDDAEFIPLPEEPAGTRPREVR